MPAFTIHAGFYGRRASIFVTIVLHCLERGLFFVAVTCRAVFFVFLTALVLVFVAKLKISHHIGRETFVTARFAFSLFHVAGGIAGTGFLPLRAGG